VNIQRKRRQKEGRLQTLNLADWLKRESLTQEQFEAASGISQTIISRAVRGEDISAESMRSIYNATRGAVTPNWLVLAAEA
jgi:transcriptional regulator with XRE-family HTH domain